LATTIISQILLNTAVVIGALPATGVPLPFFSAGGSSLATTLVMCALMVNVSRYAEPELPEDFREVQYVQHVPV
jgi:cell division protein FtsW